jgi:cytohesin
MDIMKTKLLMGGIFLGAVTFVRAATNDLTTTLQRGLFEEEANQNLGAAIQAYESVANQFDKDRKLAATAIFRLGECYRKQGNTNDAAAQYERILREFSDQPTLVTLSRQNLAALGSAPPAQAAPVLSDAARQEQKHLLEEEIKLVQTQLAMKQGQFRGGVIPQGEVFPTERELLELKRQLAALDAGPPVSVKAIEAAAPVLSDAARQEQKRLLEEEIKLVQKELGWQQELVQTKAVSQASLVLTERDLLHLKRQLAALDAGQPISVGAADATANAAAAAEAEVLDLENQLAALKGLPKDKLRIAVQQNYPNPVLNSLMQKLADAEQSVATLRKSYGDNNVEVVTAETLVETVSKQIDAQVEAVLRGLEIKRDAAKSTTEMLTAQAARARPPGEASTSSTEPATSSEADEVRRIQALIKDSPDLINAPDRKGETLLQSAAAKGKLAVIKLLLDSGAAVDGLQQPGLTALHYAAANGHKAVVDLLLSKGAKPGAETEGGVTPLHLAARKGYEEVAKALLAAGAPVNAPAKGGGHSDTEDLLYSIGSGQTPLLLAGAAGYAGLVELLLAKGADANAEDASGRTPLSYAVERRYEPVVQRLLAAHANPNAGRLILPLAMAANSGDMASLKLLLANGADPNTNAPVNWNLNTRGCYFPQGATCTPLFLAVNQRHADAARELLRCKADPNGPTPNRNPLLYEALGDAPTLEVLLEGGADPNQSVQGIPLLWWAVGDKNQPAVELLLAHHAEVNCTDPGGQTPLQAAASLGLKPIAELLLKAGATVNAKDRNGETPLHAAVRHAQPELAELLLANKADPNAKEINGRTPLHMAVNDNQREIVKLLLANKADPNERNNAGQTPLDLAKSTAQQPQSMPGMPPPPPARPAVPMRLPGAAPGYPGQPPSVPSTAPVQEAKPEPMADLLRRHGALDDLPHLDQIGIRRSATGFSNTPFTKGSHDWSQFTLLELIAVQYDLLAAGPDRGGGSSSGGPAVFFGDSRLPFPDLAHLHISRPAADLKSWQDQVVDLSPVVASGDCAKDVRLHWGDVVEVPEADHPLNERWGGFSSAELANLKKCLTRKVEIVVKGQTTTITLAPKITGLEGEEGATAVSSGPIFFPRLEPTIYSLTPFWLRPVLLQSKLVLISSDLAHVKVTRRDPATGQTHDWIVDCSKGGDSAPNLWLQDGDRIEVPEKSYASEP